MLLFIELQVLFSILKKFKKKSANLDFGDNPIYSIYAPDGQDQKIGFFWGKGFYSYLTLL